MTKKTSTLQKDFQRQSENERWRNVNVSMKSPLLERLDKVVESDIFPSNSRSKLVRHILREKLPELENDYTEET